MPKYITTMRYSPGSWARMIRSHGDRTKALRHIMEALGGRLDCVYWRFGTEDALAIVELPDSVCASALHAAVIKTGAYKKVETQELLTQEQLLETLDLARDAAEVFEVPGQGLLSRRSVRTRPSRHRLQYDHRECPATDDAHLGHLR